LLPTLQEIITAGVVVSIHTKAVESYEVSKQPEIHEAVVLLQEIGAQMTIYQMLQQRCTIIDEKIVWYGNVDFLAFGRKESDVLRFIDADTAGELLELSQGTCGQQMMIEDI
jgi:hypothetical protein